MVPGSSKIFCTSVDFPDPDGPDTMSSSGATSTAALIPLLILILGTDLSLRVTVVFLAAIWYIVLTTYNGARGVNPQQIAAARSFAANQAQ